MTETPSGEETVTGEVSEPQRKCTTQPVPIAALKLRFLSNLIPIDRSTAGTAFLTTGSPEKTVINFEFIRKISLNRLCPFCFALASQMDYFFL
jgi:hypothetical protein